MPVVLVGVDYYSLLKNLMLRFLWGSLRPCNAFVTR